MRIGIMMLSVLLLSCLVNVWTLRAGIGLDEDMRLMI